MEKSLVWTGVNTDALPMIWPLAEEFIAKSFAYDGFENLDVIWLWEKIATHQIQLWVLLEESKLVGAMLTELHMMMGQKICDIPACGGGSPEAWAEFLEEVIEPWCKEQDVDRISFTTRRGAAKVLHQHGYSAQGVLFEKDLKGNSYGIKVS